MCFQHVGLQINFMFEYNKLLLQTLTILTHEVRILKVALKCRIIDVITWLLPNIPAIAYEAPLMVVSTMLVEFIVGVEAFSTETTLRVTFESALCFRSWVIIAFSFMLVELGLCEQGVLVSKNLLVAGTEVTAQCYSMLKFPLVIYLPHDQSMVLAHVAVQIWPSTAGPIAVRIWAIVSQQQRRIVADCLIFIFYAQCIVPCYDVRIGELFKSFICVLCEDDVVRFGL